uniref:CD209 antigen-like protein E isoform X3 n=1 Tax=Gasterosteus aculeatus aculeatus TaxID=481459 RepID=UPI001A9823F2|nr:CD209 antigen-like protein E isoform X3 [Gasterosteus aculeatus aculeatus]
MDEIYANVEYVKSQVSIRPSTPAPGPSSPRSRPHVAVAVSLGLLSVLLLAGLVCLGVHVHASAAELSSIKANLTERLQVSGDKLSSVSAERDQLKDKVTALTQEKDGLQLLLKQKKTCPEGWTMFRCSCYLLSTRDGSWENGRKDCRDQGADLVIIDSLEEQKFLSSIVKSQTWIGLSDRDIEGTWKWIDETLLTAAYWSTYPYGPQPDNGGGDPRWGEEDCAHIEAEQNPQRNWNDLRCDAVMRWICGRYQWSHGG